METTTGYVIGPTCHCDVIDFVLVAKQRSHYDVIDFVFIAKRPGNKHKINDVIMTSRSHHVIEKSFRLYWIRLLRCNGRS